MSANNAAGLDEYRIPSLLNEVGGNLSMCLLYGANNVGISDEIDIKSLPGNVNIRIFIILR